MKTYNAFWADVKITDGCWEWTRAKDKDGYGVFEMEGKTWRAHRLSYFFTNGLILPGLVVCHRCDNPACVRPDHLFLGTVQENISDRTGKGRSAKGKNLNVPFGDKSPHSKLTNDDVVKILEMRSSGHLLVKIASEFSISEAHVSRIINKKSRRRLP